MTSRFDYRVYGLALRTDLPIDGLVPLSAPQPHVDCTVSLADRALPALEETGHEHAMHELAYDDGTRFLIAHDGSHVWGTWPDTSTLADTATYLLGPVLAFVLRLRRTLSMHASGVVLRDGAVLIAGPPGAGKSTTAAAFALRGRTIVTDDVAAIGWNGERPMVQPGYPRVRIWPDVAAAFYGSPDALPALTPTWEKRFVDVEASLAREEQPLRAIFLLTGRGDAVEVRLVSGADAAIALLRNTSMAHALETSLRPAELADVARLASAVPLFEVTAPDDLRRAGEVCDAIAEACR